MIKPLRHRSEFSSGKSGHRPCDAPSDLVGIGDFIVDEARQLHLKIAQVSFDSQQHTAQDERCFQTNLIMLLEPLRDLATVGQIFQKMPQVDRERLKLVLTTVGSPVREVLTQFLQIAGDLIGVVEQVLQRLAVDAQLFDDEGVVSVRPCGFLLRSFKISLMLQVHELADAKGAVGERPVHAKQAAAINFRNACSTGDRAEQPQ